MTLDEALTFHKELFSIARLVRGQDPRPTKKAKIDDLRPITIVTLNSRKGKPKPIRLTALLDSGGSGCLISKRYAKHLRVRTDKMKSVTWSTPAGELTTNQVCIAQLKLDELHPDKIIEWKFHIAPNLGNYDMIIYISKHHFLSQAGLCRITTGATHRFFLSQQTGWRKA